MGKITTFLASFGVSLAVLGGGLSAAAGSASFSLSPASATENIGTTFSLAVYENGNGSPVNVVTANLNYDQSALQFAGAACGGTFGNTVSASGGGGAVSLSCYTAPGSTPPSGAAQVGTVSFKALIGSGSTAITFAGSSIIASNGTNVWNGSAAGGTYSLTTPATPPPSSPTGSSGGSSSSGSGSTSSKKGSSSSSTASTSTGSSNNKQSSSGSSPGSSSTNSGSTAASSSSNNKSSSSSKHSNQKSRNIHSRLVSNTTSLSATAYWAIGITSLIIIAAALIFRKKLLDTAKTVSAKYSLRGHRA